LRTLIDSSHYMSKVSEEFLPPISWWTRLAGFTLAGAVIAAATLASVLQYKASIEAPGLIRPNGELKIVQADCDCRVLSIRVKENQFVNEGGVIATLENSQLANRRSQLTAVISQSQKELVELDTQILAIKNQIRYETQALNILVDSARTNLDRQKHDFFENEANSIAKLREAEANYQLAKETLSSFQSLAESGIIPKLQLIEKEKELKIAYHKLQFAQSTQKPSKSLIVIAEKEISQNKAKGSSTISSLRRDQSLIEQKKVVLQNQKIRDQKELQQVGKDIKRSILRAPSSGVILRLNIHNENQILKVGEQVAQITPVNDSLIIKTRVKSQDIGNVKINQAAYLKIPAYPYTDYGVLIGKVTSISPDVIPPSQIISQRISNDADISYYEITIVPEKKFVSKNGQKYKLKVGMDVKVEIVTDEDSLIKILLRKAKLFF
jgi:HlyD family type I secretion membrane fusion protein